MVVHLVIGFAVFGGICFVLDATGVTLGSIGASTWAFLWRASLVVMVLGSIPSTLTGITERHHMYVNWQNSHRAKLLLSLLLLGIGSAELFVLWWHPQSARLGSSLGMAVVVVNPLLCLALSFYGLRISLGRQSLARTSYVPDMHQQPPIDILDTAAHLVSDRAKVIDVTEESNP